MPGTGSDKRFESSRGSRWSQHCKLLPGSGHGRESFRSAWFPIRYDRIRYDPIRFGPISFNRNALSSFTVSPVPE